MFIIIIIWIHFIILIFSYEIKDIHNYDLYNSNRAKNMILDAKEELNRQGIKLDFTSKKAIYETMMKVLKDTDTQVYGILGNNKRRYIKLKEFLIGIGLHYKGQHQRTEFILGYTNLNMNKSTDIWLTQNGIVEKWLFTAARDRVNWFRRSIFTPEREGKEYYIHSKRMIARYQMAHLFSFINALQIFVNSGKKQMLLLEDDVYLNPYLSYEDTRIMMTALFYRPQSTWDVQHLGYCYECDIVDTKNAQETFYKKSTHPLCTHSLLISRKMAILFLHEWRPVSSRGTDEILLQLLCKYGHYVKAVRPVQPIMTQRSDNSNNSYLSSTDLKTPFYEQRGKACNRYTKSCRHLFDNFQARQLQNIVKELPDTPDFNWLRNQSDLKDSNNHATLDIKW